MSVVEIWIFESYDDELPTPCLTDNTGRLKDGTRKHRFPSDYAFAVSFGEGQSEIVKGERPRKERTQSRAIRVGYLKFCIFALVFAKHPRLLNTERGHDDTKTA